MDSVRRHRGVTEFEISQRAATLECSKCDVKDYALLVDAGSPDRLAPQASELGEDI